MAGLSGAGSRVGVLGGTFDPVHIGHLILAEAAREQLGLERVLFVPAGQPWRKVGRRIAAVEHRLAMLRVAIEGNPAFEVYCGEARRLGPSYSVETLEAIRGESTSAELFFILGEDALEDLPKWRAPGRIVELATLAVARRPGGVVTAEGGGARSGGASARAVWLQMPLIDISSSRIRERVRRGLSIRYWVPEAVERYIRGQGLYRR